MTNTNAPKRALSFGPQQPRSCYHCASMVWHARGTILSCLIAWLAATACGRVADGRLIVLMEGWRWVPHSYAIVNSYHQLALQAIHQDDPRRVEIYVRDKEFPLATSATEVLNATWPRQHYARLRAIPTLPAGIVPDVVVRHTVPWDLGPAFLQWQLDGGAASPAVVLVATTETKAAPRHATAGTVSTIVLTVVARSLTFPPGRCRSQRAPLLL